MAVGSSSHLENPWLQYQHDPVVSIHHLLAGSGLRHEALFVILIFLSASRPSRVRFGGYGKGGATRTIRVCNGPSLQVAILHPCPSSINNGTSKVRSRQRR